MTADRRELNIGCICPDLGSTKRQVLMDGRATLDPKVTAEWARRCARSRKASRTPRYILIAAFLAALSPPIFGVVAYLPYLVYLAVIAAFAAAMFPGAAFASLRCPNCNRILIPVGPVPLTPIDFCPHCRFWLVDPRGRTST